MEAGEKELRKVFEEVTTRNVNTIKDYTTDTRNLVRDLENEVKQLKKLVMSRDEEFRGLQAQIANIQQKLYSSGT